MARVAGRHGAIEHFVTHFKAGGNADRMPDPQGVNGELAGNETAGVFKDIANEVAFVIERPASKTKAVKTQFKQRFSAAFAQVKFSTALNDGEK